MTEFNTEGIAEALQGATAEIAAYKEEVRVLNEQKKKDAKARKTLVRVMCGVVLVFSIVIGGLGYLYSEVQGQADALCNVVNENRSTQYDTWNTIITLANANPREVPVDATPAERAQFEEAQQRGQELLAQFQADLAERLAPVDCTNIDSNASNVTG
jgi:hypothetical protein